MQQPLHHSCSCRAVPGCACGTIPIHCMHASPLNPVSGWRVPPLSSIGRLGHTERHSNLRGAMQPLDWLTHCSPSHTPLTGRWPPHPVVRTFHTTCPLRLTSPTLPQVTRMRTVSPPSASLPRCLQKPWDCCHCLRALEAPRRSGCWALLARALFDSPHFRIGGELTLANLISAHALRTPACRTLLLAFAVGTRCQCPGRSTARSGFGF